MDWCRNVLVDWRRNVLVDWYRDGLDVISRLHIDLEVGKRIGEIIETFCRLHFCLLDSRREKERIRLL